MATESVRPGVVLDGKYEILNLLGAGGMGEVFKARHVHLNAFRCIKVMKQGLLADDVYRSRFLREAQLATQIHHPNIAVVHDFFLAERGSYMVTEFIDGTTVRQWSKAFGRFPLPLAADVGVQVLGGLDHIHRRGLLHRDISADNIMLSYERDDSLAAKIIDLGIAKDVNVVSTETMAGMLVGNPKYMSPEQLGDLGAGEQVDNRADLYCLGVVLYEMLLGVPPFVSETPHGYIVKHLTQAPRPFAVVAPGLDWPEGLEAVIFRALEKDRRNRYADAREFSAALQPFLGAPPGSLSKTSVERLRRLPDKTLVEKMPEAATEVTPAAPTETQTERDWRKTIAEDSISGYREYIERHPHAPDTTEAKARLFELSLLEDVREREKESDRDALKRLAEGHPPGSLVGNAARDALARLRNAQQEAQAEDDDFQRAWEIGTSATWRAFIDKYAASPRAVRAQEFLDEAAAFEAAAATEVETGVRQFLKLWPDGRHHLEAEIRLVELKQRLAGAAFAQALAFDTSAALRDFLARFPSSSHTEDAKRALAERLAFETAAAADSQNAWESYLAAWGADRHADEARARFERVRAGEEDAFRVATDAKTAAAWQAFLSKYPDGRSSARAERNRREAEAFEAARSGGGRAAMETFLQTYPDGLLIREARRLARQLADEDDFAHARSLDRPAAWSLYLTTHPAGAHAEEARARLAEIEETAFAGVMAAKDSKSGAAFLTDFPHSPRREHVARLVTDWTEAAALRKALDAVARGDTAEAESLLRGIANPERRSELAAALDALARQTATARRRTEPRDWDAAWEAGSVAAWDRYLADHPDSERAAEARLCRQEAVDFELAVTTATASMWRAFLKAWPEGRHRLDAEVRLKSK